MKTIIIESDHKRSYAKTLVDDIPANGKYEVIIKGVDKSSTAKQRRLKWRWNHDISRSGIGQHDTPDGVHLFNKKKFGHDIFLRDNDNYGCLFTGFRDRVIVLDDYARRMNWFFKHYVQTEKFTKAQQSEYMTNVLNYWSKKGVVMTHPDDMGCRI